MAASAPDALLRLIDRFDLGRRVFLYGDCKEGQLPRTKTPHEQESLKRTIVATDKQIGAPAHLT